MITKTLSSTEEKQIDTIGIQAIKTLFNLPIKTPSIAIIYYLGLLYTTQSIDQRKFMYLYKILNRERENWTNKMLHHLHSQNKGWAKSINEKLQEYNLESDWMKIKSHTKNQWKDLVEKAICEKNKQKLIANSTSPIPQGVKINTKTVHIHTALTTTLYKREPSIEIVSRDKQRTKTIIMAQSGMLECGKNFKGTMNESCAECDTIDNEEHRLNNCYKWVGTNNVGKEKIDFNDIYSNDLVVLNRVIDAIEKVWELRFANGRMKELR